MGMTARYDDTTLEELLGAYALDACEPDEAAAIEDLLERRADLMIEANRLSRAAAWVGATEALAPPRDLRANLLRVARDRGTDSDDPAGVYRAATSRMLHAVDAFDEDHGDVPTPNGLRARDLIVHLAAQQSALADAIGETTEPTISETDIEARTAAFVEQYSSRPLDDARRLLHRSVDAVRRWAESPASQGTTVSWCGLHWERDNLLLAAAFEIWVHREDLRAVDDLPLDPPPPREIHQMADLSVRTLPLGLLVQGNDRAGRVARVRLTGPGGDEWLVAMDAGEIAAGAVPDVTLTADIVDWCLVAGERVAPADLARTVDGDESLADDLVAAAPAFATL
jgi:hypothetical protein